MSMKICVAQVCMCACVHVCVVITVWLLFAQFMCRVVLDDVLKTHPCSLHCKCVCPVVLSTLHTHAQCVIT